MARGKLWGYVASGARVLGALGGGIGGALGGTLGGTGGAGGGRAGEPDDGAAAVEGLGLVRPGAVAGPRALSRPELERLRWTGRQAGCGPLSRHVQVADVLRRVVRGGGRSANVTVRVAPGLPVVAGDARRLEAAVAGLVDHAIRRSPLGARVSVRAEAAGGPGSGAAAWDRGRVEVRISDRGWYEPPEAREWLLARVRPGGPVGPALHSLVLAAGGWIAVEPTPGGGLTVVLLLAVAQE